MHIYMYTSLYGHCTHGGSRDQLHYGRVFIFACCQHKQCTFRIILYIGIRTIIYIYIYYRYTQSRISLIIVTTTNDTFVNNTIICRFFKEFHNNLLIRLIKLILMLFFIYFSVVTPSSPSPS